jgi:hypothetical protein
MNNQTPADTSAPDTNQTAVVTNPEGRSDGKNPAAIAEEMKQEYYAGGIGGNNSNAPIPTGRGN